MLKFSKANAKTIRLAKTSLKKYLNGRKIYSLDLLSGVSCPFAHKCFSTAIVKNGRRSIQDGKHTEFRCYSASQEVLYTNLYKLRLHNLTTLKKCKTVKDFVDTIQKNLPKDAGIIRIHSAGEMFCQEYFDAWNEVARLNPTILFYSYTKSLPYWVKRLGNISPNLILTASLGGRRDDLIDKYKLRSARVVYSTYQAKRLGLRIDKSDEIAANPQKKNQSFALLLHNSQPAGSEAAKAWQRIKFSTGGYSR